MGKEDFPDSGKQLFGDGFESRLKLRSETADTVAQAKQASRPFFVGLPLGDLKGGTGVAEVSPAKDCSNQCEDFDTKTPHFEAEGECTPSTQPLSSNQNNSDASSTSAFLPQGMYHNFVNYPNLPIAGRLKHFLPAWDQVTKDPWVFQVTQGYLIEFMTEPVQTCTPVNMFTTQEDQNLIDQEVQELLAKQAVYPVSRSS